MYRGTKYLSFSLKMFIKNEKPIKIIGFSGSSITEEYFEVFSKENLKEISIITPCDFKSLENKEDYQYIIAFYLDMELRKEVCNLLDDLDLDCVTYIDDSVYMFPSSHVGKGCFIGHQSILSWNCVVGDHCYIAMTTLIGHDVIIGRNCITSPRVDFAGRVIVGENCKFFYKAAMLPKVKVCNDVILCALSNLTKDAEKPGTYVGSRARLMKPETTDKDL
jgi:acetyltransferase-like isoleucine patch superfamily enzyme